GAGIGEDDALDAAVADVALVPEGDVLQRGNGVAPDDAGEAGESFPGDRVAFVRHGAAALLAFRERFLGFENFRALEVAELDGPALDARTDECQRIHELGVNVALHDLRGNQRRAQAEFFAYDGFHGGRQMRAGPDSAA